MEDLNIKVAYVTEECMPKILMRCIVRESSDETIHIMINFLQNQLQNELKKNQDFQHVVEWVRYYKKHLLHYTDESMNRKSRLPNKTK